MMELEKLFTESEQALDAEALGIVDPTDIRSVLKSLSAIGSGDDTFLPEMQSGALLPDGTRDLLSDDGTDHRENSIGDDRTDDDLIGGLAQVGVGPLDVTVANNSEGFLVLDIDRNGRLEALADGMMIIRHLFGLPGNVVVQDAVAPDGTRTDAVEITSYLDELGLLLDVDGDGELGALTDGLMIIRDLFELPGEIVVQNAVAPGAPRNTVEAVTAYLEFLKNLTDGPTINQPPVAVDDSFTIIQGTPAAELAVLNNDSDPDGDMLSITDVADPSNGTVSINGDRVLYNPEAGFLGVDTFTYNISDGNGGTDRATVQVTVTETPTQTITWVGESGFWDDASNWSTGEVPGADDIVLIDVPGDRTITIRQGETIVTSIFSEENFVIDDDALFIVTGESVVNGDLTISDDGSLSAIGANASFVANDAVAIDGASLWAVSGGTISLPGATSFRVQDAEGAENFFAAVGAGSVLDLSNLTSLAGSAESETYLVVGALEGGQIDLSGVTEITGPSGGTGDQRGIQILADGTDSQVDLSSLTSFTNDAPNPNSRLRALNGGTILADNLTIVNGVVVEPTETPTRTITWVGESGFWNDASNWSTGEVPGANDIVLIDVPGDQTITIRRSEATVTSIFSEENFVIDDDALFVVTGESVVNGDLTISDDGSLSAIGANASFVANDAVAIDGANLVVRGGGTISLPGATSFQVEDTEAAVNLFQASGAGSVLDLSNLTSLAGSGYEFTYLFVEAEEGGRIDLSGVTEITGPPARPFSVMNERGIQVLADGTDSEVDLSSLTSFTNDARDPDSRLAALNGGQVLANNLTTLHGVDIQLDDAEKLRTSQIATYNQGTFTVEGTTVSLSNLSDIDSSSFIVEDGGTLELPAATSFTVENVANAENFFRASGAGSVLDLSNLTSLAGAEEFKTYLFVEAEEGGQVDLSGVTEITGPSQGSFGLRGIQVLAEGTSSEVDLSSLTSFTNDAPTPDSRLRALNGGQVLTNNLTTLNAVDIDLDGTGILPISQIATYNRGTVTVKGTTVSFSNLSDIDNSSFIVEDGGTLELPGATSFKILDEFADNFFRASGAGSVLDLSNLTSLAGSEEAFTYLFVEALEGGQVDLSGVTEITGPSGDSRNERGIQVLADGTDSEVDLSSLTSFTNDAFTPDSRLAALNGGQVLANNLTTLNGNTVTIQGTTVSFSNLRDIDRSSFIVEDGGTLSLPAATSFKVQDAAGADNFFRASGAGSVLDLSNLTRLAGSEEAFTYLLVEAEEGGQVDLSGVTEITGPSGDSRSERGIQVRADGTDSEVDLSSLTSFTNDASNPDSRLALINGGTILANNLTTLDGVDINLDNAEALPISQMTTYNRGTVTVKETAASLSSLRDIDDSNFIVEDGGTLSLLAATSFKVEDAVNADKFFRASGAGSVLDLSNLTSLAGPLERLSYLFVEAEEGGQIDLSGVTEITEPSQGSSSARGIQVLADGTDSEVDLSSLISFTNDAPTPDSRLAALNGGQVLANNLTTLNGNTVTVKETTISFSNLRDIDGSSFIVEDGGTLELPGATSFTVQDDEFADYFFRASGTGSVLDLSNLTSLAGSAEPLTYLFVEALEGGQVDLSGVTEITGPSGDSISGRGIQILADGTGSEVDLSSLISFTNDAPRPNSRLRALNGGIILADNLTIINGVDVEI